MSPGLGCSVSGDTGTVAYKPPVASSISHPVPTTKALGMVNHAVPVPREQTREVNHKTELGSPGPDLEYMWVLQGHPIFILSLLPEQAEIPEARAACTRL